MKLRIHTVIMYCHTIKMLIFNSKIIYCSLNFTSFSPWVALKSTDPFVKTFELSGFITSLFSILSCKVGTHSLLLNNPVFMFTNINYYLMIFVFHYILLKHMFDSSFCIPRLKQQFNRCSKIQNSDIRTICGINHLLTFHIVRKA